MKERARNTEREHGNTTQRKRITQALHTKPRAQCWSIGRLVDYWPRLRSMYLGLAKKKGGAGGGRPPYGLVVSASCRRRRRSPLVMAFHTALVRGSNVLLRVSGKKLDKILNVVAQLAHGLRIHVGVCEQLRHRYCYNMLSVSRRFADWVRDYSPQSLNRCSAP